MNMVRNGLMLIALTAAGVPAVAQEKPKVQSKPTRASAKTDAYPASYPKPTFAEVAYGPHERNVMDVWQAKSDMPTPLVVVIHGGSWTSGSKERLSRFVDAPALLDAGISVVAINYRLIQHAGDAEPPVKAALYDAARALQFVRTKSKEWNIDPSRIAVAGGSAGACSSLWLAYHDDLADPQSRDPVARESTRVVAAACVGAQTSLDPKQMKEWTPNSVYGGHAFGKKNFAEFLESRETILPWIAAYSPYALASQDDPPVYLSYGSPPELGKPQQDPTHTANFGVALQQRCRELKIECELVYPSAPAAKHHPNTTAYLIDHFKNNFK